MITKYPDYRFFLFVAAIIGLSHYNLNLVDDHAWRQSLTVSIAKNMLEYPNPLYPRTVFCCKGDYIIGSEFPLFNILMALSYKVFGYQPWYGRLINLVFSLLGAIYFYKIVARLFSKRSASFAAIFLLSSIFMVFGRKSMPDTFSISLVIMSVWFLMVYLDSQQSQDLILGLLLLMLGGLSKFPAYCCLSFLTFPLMEAPSNKKLKMKLLMGIFGVSVIVSFWYLFWMPYLTETYGNQLVWPSGVWEGLVTIFNDAERAWYRFEVNAFGFRLPFFLSTMGLGIAWFSKDRSMILTFLVFAIMYTGFISKAGVVFTDHNYYILPFVPMLALLAGYAVDKVIHKDWLACMVMTVLFYFGVMSNLQLSRPLDYMKDYPRLTQIVNRYTKKGDKVLINLGQFNPVGLYFADRFGWSENNDVLARTDWMPDYKKMGLKIIIVDKERYPNPKLPYALLYEDTKFSIYQP